VHTTEQVKVGNNKLMLVLRLDRKRELSRPLHHHVEDEQTISRAARSDDCTCFNVWSLGISIAIGGTFMSWNQGLSCGFGNFLLATSMVGLAYFSLIVCISEMLSALPFAGGAYGIARCTLGFYPGFLVGCCEAFELIISVSQAALACASMICNIFGIAESVASPLICILLYIFSAGIQIQGGILFWRAANTMAVASCIFLLVFLVTAFKHTSFDRYAVSTSPLFHCHVSGFLLNLPLSAWFYGGVETLAFTCDLATTSNPKTAVPRGSVVCISTLIAVSLSIALVASSLPPGLDFLQLQTFPLNTGFMYLGVSFQMASFFSFIPTFASLFGFMFAYGRLLFFLATSGLLPEYLSRRWKPRKTPAAAIIAGSLVSYGASLLIFFFPLLGNNIFNICILPAFVGYCAQCVGYINLKIRFAKLKRLYHSPLGVFGAIFALFVFLICIVSILGFQQDHQTALICNAVVLFLLSVYYFTVAQARQTFSAEEQKIYGTSRVIRSDLQAALHRRRARELRGHLSVRSPTSRSRPQLNSRSVHPNQMAESYPIQNRYKNQGQGRINAPYSP